MTALTWIVTVVGAAELAALFMRFIEYIDKK